jgi:signal transduction histidine kinase/ActR/RegA family two-component response regulator
MVRTASKRATSAQSACNSIAEILGVERQSVVTRGIMKRNHNLPELYEAQIDAVYRQAPIVLTVNMVNSTLVAVLLSSYSGQTSWLLFLMGNVASTGAQLIGCLFYYARKEFVGSARAWAIVATLGSGLSGFLWGAGSAFLLPDNLVEETFVAFVIGGMCVASLVSFACHIPAFVAYVFPASLPLAARFFMDGWAVHGDMMVVFAVAITVAACNSSRGFAAGLRTNLELRERTKQLAVANGRLESEIEQRSSVEDQLRQAQKMEAIGQLTGGIAHDFNNVLTAIIGHLEMAQDLIESGDPRTIRLVQAAVRAADRGATLTRHLLAFGRRQRLEPKVVDVAAVIRSIADVLSQTMGPDIRVLTEAKCDLYPAWADPDQLELAILNLALNARDAMPGGGRLVIKAENQQAQCNDSQSVLACGDYVVVSVSDTGTGMDAETLVRAFEPFFTTKEVGRGSGLGLSIVHGFAAQSGGSVQISSSPGRGTKVDLWLPRTNGIAVQHAEPEQEPYAAEPYQGRILVCDDDNDVRSLVGAYLRDIGYTVWEADNPRVALEILERESPLDVFIVDYAMPDMNGLTVIERARNGQHGLKVLLMSGHADILQVGGLGGIPLLAKPFKVADLATQIIKLLRPFDTEMEESEPRLIVVPS